MTGGNRHSVRIDKTGLRRLEPLPDTATLDEFYRDTYYAANEGKAPDIKRLRDDAEAAQGERTWRNRTIYADVLHYIARVAPDGGRVVDVGCGTGEFVAFMADTPGWDACGVEPAPDAVALAVDRDLQVEVATIDDVDDRFGGGFDALTMFNVLEHVLDPWAMLTTAHELLRPGGVLVVQVPNDFSPLQEAVRSHLDVAPWWVAVPDHINYFDFETLDEALRRHGFHPTVQYGSFPMEFFLVGGLDYVNDPASGPAAHRARCAFEMSMTDDQRRELFEDFARGRLGRNALIVATKGPPVSD